MDVSKLGAADHVVDAAVGAGAGGAGMLLPGLNAGNSNGHGTRDTTSPPADGTTGVKKKFDLLGRPIHDSPESCGCGVTFAFDCGLPEGCFNNLTEQTDPNSNSLGAQSLRTDCDLILSHLTSSGGMDLMHDDGLVGVGCSTACHWDVHSAPK
jgi:hypothetical protein